MIISRTPVRISFFGGGTDYPAYFLKHPGATLSTTINKYTTIVVHPLPRFTEHAIQLSYSQMEKAYRLDEIEHHSARECLRFLGIDKGVEIHYISNLPARTGLGSSSSATVGLLNALYAFKGESAAKLRLAEEAVHVEQDLIKERVGCQDQYACALGGFLYMEYGIDGKVKVKSLKLKPSRLKHLNERLMLFYTGTQRTAHEIAEEQIQRTQEGKNEEGLERIAELAKQGLELVISNNNLDRFGELLHENWMIKRQLSSKITTSKIDEQYERARMAGATGGKILGAGGGGFFLFYVEPENQEKVRLALPELYQVDFSFENSGSQIIFSDNLK